MLDVAVGVVLRADGAVLIGQRVAGKPYAGWWEFPGGKLEPGEGVAQALARELHEELGLEVESSTSWVVRGHVYPHATVRLFFRRVRRWRGEPQSREGQALVWRRPPAIDVAPLLPAALAPIGWLQMPALLRLSCAAEMGVTAWLRALQDRLDEAPWVVLREPLLPEAEVESLFERLRGWRAAGRLRLLVSSRHPPSFAAAADGG